MPRWPGYKLSEETKRKIGLANKGKVHSEEQNKQTSERMKKNPLRYWLGKKRPDIGEKISKANKGRTAWNKGIPMSEEQKKKCSESRKKLFASGYILPWTGKPLSEERKRKISEFHKGRFVEEKNHNWKGDNVGYTGIHKWIVRHRGIPNHCEICGTAKKVKYHWANKDHKYRRVLEDYISLCVSCHRKYDIENNNYLIGFIKSK